MNILHPTFVLTPSSAKKGAPLGNWTCHDEPSETHGLRANWFKVQGSSLGFLTTGLWGMCDSFAPCPINHVQFIVQNPSNFTQMCSTPHVFFVQPPGTKRDRRFRPWVVWVINFGRLWTCVRIAGPEAVWRWRFLINIGCFPQIRSSHKQIIPCIWYLFHKRNLLHPQNLPRISLGMFVGLGLGGHLWGKKSMLRSDVEIFTASGSSRKKRLKGRQSH